MSAAEKIESQRARHPDPKSPMLRVKYIADIMSSGQWERGVTGFELEEDWGVPHGTMLGYASQASTHLKLLGDREHVLQRVRFHADRWVNEGSNDRVSAAKLLLETVGGVEQRHVVKHELSNRSEAELFMLALTEIKADPQLRAKAISFLQADDMQPELLLTEGEEIHG